MIKDGLVIKSIMAVLSATLVGLALASEGVGNKVASTCGFDTDHFLLVNNNVITSGVDKSVCWGDQVAVGGVAMVRYTDTRNDEIEAQLDMARTFTLNHASLIVDAKVNDSILAHMTMGDVEAEHTATNYEHQFRVDEARVFYHHPTNPLSFEFGYGFVDFGNMDNPYDYARPPTRTAATNQDVLAGVGWMPKGNGVYGEFFVVGDYDPAWGGALGLKVHVGRVLADIKTSMISDNEHVDAVNGGDGGIWDLSLKVEVPDYRLKFQWDYVHTRQVDDYLKIWSVDGSYGMSFKGVPMDVHGFYAKNRQTSVNHFAGYTVNNVRYHRFNVIEYNTILLDRVWNIGFGIDLLKNLSLTFDYINSNGINNGSNGMEDYADFNSLTAAVTAHF